MANLNKEMCDCMGFYDPSGGCMPYDPEVHADEPCPGGFWQTVGSWDWGAISENAMNWGYALGLFQPPNQNLETQMYMAELQRQRQQMTMIMVGLGIAMLVILIVVVRKK
tara:strand:- start:108 stop:437 length:330 start_codon:yes stop_codon:yes gene_type:complete